ncbi:MAG TPA: choice-of-anchor tandem repeat GloVer-containing protein [Rhizomicrobium sp.]|nr:choice-of-anchor tandem repeat GloVer-containing protein [Rhizomicrobium sp.]
MTPAKTSYATHFLSAGLFVCALAALAPAAGAATESVVYSFQDNGNDGVVPDASLIDVNGTLYGTTEYGGTGHCQGGCGTIFSVNAATGAETILHDFEGFERTINIPGSLIALKGGLLFGTALYGGHRDGGMLFSLDLQSGHYKQRHDFCELYDCMDGEAPNPGLLESQGTIYGTTNEGGVNGGGTVFSFDRKTRAETVLYSFCSGCQLGGGLLGVKGTLYGTTAYGNGAVFSLDPSSGVESIIYYFCTRDYCEDGARPNGNLIHINRTLYGTTNAGGSYNLGTVFSIRLKRDHETVLHAFAGGADGRSPDSGLIEVNGMLYGTTPTGGSSGTACLTGEGCGTVYSIDPNTGAETIVYSFCSQAGCADGDDPAPGLVYADGTLYGVTEYGGSGTCNGYGGCGTVFAITP